MDRSLALKWISKYLYERQWWIVARVDCSFNSALLIHTAWAFSGITNLDKICHKIQKFPRASVSQLATGIRTFSD